MTPEQCTSDPKTCLCPRCCALRMADVEWKVRNAPSSEQISNLMEIKVSKRVVVNVATGAHYLNGQNRLRIALGELKEAGLCYAYIPAGWPQHRDTPYAFKACALQAAADRGHRTLLWADACIYPLRSLEPLWDRIERDGYWFGANGYTNAEWTADSAYPYLFPDQFKMGHSTASMREMNRNIPHVVATAFGISLDHDIGREFLAEYYRMANETSAFYGPWINSNHPDWLKQPGALKGGATPNGRVAQCGPVDVRGHRHDQTAASVLAWRAGMKLTNSPEIFAYGKVVGDATDERTILLADGSYS